MWYFYKIETSATFTWHFPETQELDLYHICVMPPTKPTHLRYNYSSHYTVSQNICVASRYLTAPFPQFFVHNAMKSRVDDSVKLEASKK